MRFEHPEHPGRAVRLAYCLNLHPADTLAGLLEGLRAITLPLRERLAPGRGFGVGMYAPARLAAHLAGAEGGDERRALKAFLDEHGLDPFTWNAFPYGGFGASGLKERVFRPPWGDPQRGGYTLDVAFLASSLAGAPRAGSHLSISTHTGWHAAHPPEPDALEEGEPPRPTFSGRRADRSLLELAARLRDHARQGAPLGPAGRGASDAPWPVVLALEPEPRSRCNDSADLARLWSGLERHDEGGARRAHLGACLDACHAAVEFEDPEAALANATAAGAPLGKLQFTSALAVDLPGPGLDLLRGLDEPRFLHQVTGWSRARGLVRAGDIPEVVRALAAGGEPARAWRACEELRCHFHLPVDLADLRREGLALEGVRTTRAHADAALAAALARPARWGTDELHVEIETYTWSVLPSEARGAGALVDGLEREYAHVLSRLAAAGWRPA